MKNTLLTRQTYNLVNSWILHEQTTAVLARDHSTEECFHAVYYYFSMTKIMHCFFLELFKSTKYIWEEHTRRTYTRTYTYLLTVLTRIKMEHVQVFFSISKWSEAHLRTVPLRNQNSRLTHHISIRHSRVIHVALSVKKQYEKITLCKLQIPQCLLFRTQVATRTRGNITGLANCS